MTGVANHSQASAQAPTTTGIERPNRGRCVVSCSLDSGPAS